MPRKKKNEVLENKEVEETKDELVVMGIDEMEETEDLKSAPYVAPRVVREVVGVKSKGVVEDDPETKKYNEYIKLLGYKRDKSLIWVKVTSSEVDEKSGKPFVRCDWNGISIIVPEHNYFMQNYNFSENYKNLSEDDKLKERIKTLEYQINAKICLLIDYASSYVNDDGSYGYLVTGNRVEAMKLLQWIYFKDPNIKAEYEIVPDTILKANVLSVSRLNVLVECLGVETRIDRFNLAYNVIQSCHDVVEVGDVIDVRVRKVHPHKEDDELAYLTVSARVANTKNIAELIKEGGVYSGVVSRYNLQKQFYTVTLKNNVNVVVLKKHSGRTPIRVGDEVTVRVSGMNEKNGIGYIIGLTLKRY